MKITIIKWNTWCGKSMIWEIIKEKLWNKCDIIWQWNWLIDYKKDNRQNETLIVDDFRKKDIKHITPYFYAKIKYLILITEEDISNNLK